MGQGVHTALAQMLADELDADWNLVDVQEAPAHAEYANHNLAKGFLFGDAEIPSALVGTVDGRGPETDPGDGPADHRRESKRPRHRAARDAGRRRCGSANAGQGSSDSLGGAGTRACTQEQPYPPRGEADERQPMRNSRRRPAQIPPSSKPRLKDSKAFSLIGTSVKRQDVPTKVDGSAAFGIDAQLPDLKTATVRSCPVFGGAGRSRRRVGGVETSRCRTRRQPGRCRRRRRRRLLARQSGLGRLGNRMVHQRA